VRAAQHRLHLQRQTAHKVADVVGNLTRYLRRHDIRWLLLNQRRTHAGGAFLKHLKLHLRVAPNAQHP
jgi:hypothetical protein